MRENKDLPEEFLEIFVVDESFKPIGIVPSSKVLRTPRESKMSSIMEDPSFLVPVDMDREEVGNIFENYDLCTKVTLSFKELHLVLDVVNEYSFNSTDNDISANTNNMNDNISFDAPPFFAYWLNYDDLKNSENENIIDIDWTEQDLLNFNNLDLSNYFNTYNADNSKRLFVEPHLGNYYINLSEKILTDVSECNSITEEFSCDESCIWHDYLCQCLNRLELCDSNYVDNFFILLTTYPKDHNFY